VREPRKLTHSDAAFRHEAAQLVTKKTSLTQQLRACITQSHIPAESVKALHEQPWPRCDRPGPGRLRCQRNPDPGQSGLVWLVQRDRLG
jgi:hypothetical protein